MGGKAFARHDPPILTPRLPPALYYSLREKYIFQTSKLFEYVASPLEAPAKSDHGDIDILVSQPRLEELSALLTEQAFLTNGDKPEFGTSSSTQECPLNMQIEAVKSFFRPTAWLLEHSTVNLALPHPSAPNQYVQLDVHIVQSYTEWRWLLFQHSYGDVFNILGTSLRDLGLVGNDRGLYLCDAEIEPHNRKKSLVYLTNNPEEFLHFLGLERRHWFAEPGALKHADDPFCRMEPASPFKSNLELFTAVSRMRFFRADAYAKANLKRSDRSRIQRRSMYRSFIEEYLPTLPPPAQPTVTREQVLEEVLTRWDASDRWKTARKAWEWERLDLLSRQKFREEKRFRLARLCAYADAWIEWCGLETDPVSGTLVRKSDPMDGNR